MLLEAIRKEAKQLLSDKGFIMIALIQPLVLIMVFGSAFQGGLFENIKVAVVDDDKTTFSGYVVRGIADSQYFRVMAINNGTLEENMEKVKKSDIRAVLHIPKGFDKNLNNSITGNVKFYLDSSDFITYNTLLGAQSDIIKKALVNISEDILSEIEEQKDYQKQKADEIKSIFEKIDAKTEPLRKDFNKTLDKIREIDTAEIEDALNELEEELDNQQSEIALANQNLDYLIGLVISINTAEQDKINETVTRLIVMKAGLSEMQEKLQEASNELSSIDISGPQDVEEDFDNIEEKLNEIEDIFEEARDVSDSINFDFKKLKKSFLSSPIDIAQEPVFGPIRYFDWLAPGVLSLVVFFLGMIVSSISVIREKENNTLFRMATLPRSTTGILFGKLILIGFFGFIELIYTVFLTVFLFKLRVTGSIYDVIIILTLLSFASISLGLFISARVKSMQQALILVPLIVISFFIISQGFLPQDFLPDYVKYISLFSPMTYAVHALRAIMLKGWDLTQLGPDLFGLFLAIIIPLILFIISFRKIKY